MGKSKTETNENNSSGKHWTEINEHNNSSGKHWTEINENNSSSGKHWTEIYQENARRYWREQRKKRYRELYPDMDFYLDDYGFGDEHFFFDGEDGSPKYEDVDEPWDKFIDWLKTIMERMSGSDGYEERGEYRLGRDMMVYAEIKRAHTIYIMMKINWVLFRDHYLLVEDCPEYILEFVRGIMHDKMTEKQMWGTDEDRMPEGTIICFDKCLMPKEGTNTGKLKFEYRPNYIQEMQEAMRKGKFR